ncbi:MAG: ABC transporter ATP-binding protein [Thermoplasmata archaeon]
MSLLEVEGLTVTYASRDGPIAAVRDLDLVLERGQTLGLIGESGCGKSTLGKAILRILPEGTQVEGFIRFDGKNLATADEDTLEGYRGRNLSMIFQDPMTRLDPLMTVRKHFIELIRAHEPDAKGAGAITRARRALTAVRIPPDRLNQYPHEFSGGMRQRIMIALALVFNPSLLIADEPTTSLDVIVEAQILQLLNSIKQDFDMGVLLITHNLGLVSEYADEIAVMYAGRIAERGRVEDVFAEPLHPYTKGLLESVIGLETTALKSIPGQPPDLLNPPSGCPFHPRCPAAMDVCSTAFPPTTHPRVGRDVACYLYP